MRATRRRDFGSPSNFDFRLEIFVLSPLPSSFFSFLNELREDIRVLSSLLVRLSLSVFFFFLFF